ncbi:unnamed protein product [Ophioblennius macclurei]
MSPQQQQQDSLSRSGAQQDNKRRMKSQSYRRQSAPSLVITKALTRSKTLSRDSFLVPMCPETCPLVQSFLSVPHRSFLLHAHAQLKTGMQTQNRHLFLFSDLLVLAKAKSANHFKQKAQASVCEMWTAGCMDEVCEGSTSLERSFVMGWPTCNCVAMFSSMEQKESWLSLLKSRIREEKEKEEPKTIPLRVYGKGINTFAVTKTLPVSNSDSTNEVIRLALQQFGIIGNIRDYQLWVISKRDNTPYPLIGHEFPFSIQMSHVRQSRPHEGGGQDAADRQAEHMQVYKHCQFILKPRPAGPSQHNIPADFAQRTLKRRRSLIAWAFWRGPASHSNELSLTSAARGSLFGHPLNSICFEDALPKPVMDMLAFLYHEGAWTRGIFRRPAGARAVRELRDSLDAGETHLPLTRDFIFIIAGVFKEFLRSIPGSLLCCELHEEWMDVPEEDEDEEEQVQDVQRMIHRLPKENALLLRYLLAVLHSIQANAHENQMTSFNLSVCIAPSMLWPPGAPRSPEVEGEGTKRVCELVKFMIEHCQKIIGEDPCSLFGGPPQRFDSEEMETEPWVYPLTDSSYDSLENELDNSSGGSPTFCSRRRLRNKPLQGSLDSILTFSDDQDTGAGNEPTHNQCIVSTSATLDSLSLEGRRTQRRKSEPAISYTSKFQPYNSSSVDGLAGDDEDEMKTSSHPCPRAPTRRIKAKTTALEASSSSLSSTPASPAYTLSSLDSLDSLDQTCATKQSLFPTKPHHPPSEHQDRHAKDQTPKEAINWGPLKCSRGLHPNSWLKKDRRLSLTQQENVEKEEEGGSETGSTSITLGKLATEKGTEKQISRSKASSKGTKEAAGGGSYVRGRPGQEQQDLFSPPSHHRSTGSLLFNKASCFQSLEFSRTVTHPSEDSVHRCEGQPVSPLFYKPSGPSLSLFKRHKSHSMEEEGEECKTRLCHRRGSEPGRQLVDRASSASRARLPSDPGLKVSEVGVNSQGEPSEAARFCLSPYATKAVRDYFSSHPRSSPQSSQQVALALVESRREWLKRCSDPTSEPDLDQLLFAEESYV